MDYLNLIKVGTERFRAELHLPLMSNFNSHPSCSVILKDFAEQKAVNISKLLCFDSDTESKLH